MSLPQTQDTDTKEPIDPSFFNDNSSFTFLNRKRLKKQKEIIIEKKIAKKIANSFIEKEAELGSDNEEHDDIVKKISDSDYDSEKDPNIDENLNDIIDDNVDNVVDQHDKFVDDMFQKDKEEIKKVIDGPVVRKEEKRKERLEIDESDLPLKLRIERMTEQEGKNEEEVNFNTILKKYKNLKHKFEEDEINGENNEEVKEALETYKANAIKKINEMKKIYKDEIKERIKEDKQILKNVVVINKPITEDKSKNNKLIVKGNGKISSISSLKFGKFLNKNNSFLCNFKNEKNEDGTVAPTPKIENTNKVLPGFANNFSIGASSLSSRAGNLTTLFTRKK